MATPYPLYIHKYIYAVAGVCIVRRFVSLYDDDDGDGDDVAVATAAAAGVSPECVSVLGASVHD